MKATFLVFHPGQSVPEVLLIDGPPTLDALKAGIGDGHLEAVPYFDRIEHDGHWHNCVAFRDEDGKLKQLPMNVRATRLWNQALLKRRGCTADPDFLVGQILVVIGDDEFMVEL